MSNIAPSSGYSSREPSVVARVWTDRLIAGTLAGAFLILYIFLGQRSFYKSDGPCLVLLSEFGIIRHPTHAAYMPILESLRLLLQPLGYTTYEAAVMFSALGTAVGVFFVSLAFASVLSRTHAILGTLLVAACPVNAFFATVVEFHGPYFACVALAFYLALKSDPRSPHWGYLRTGITIGLASMVHSSALLLCLPCFAWMLHRQKVAGGLTQGLVRALIVPVFAMFIALGVSMVCMQIASTLGYIYPPVSRYDALMVYMGEQRGLGELVQVLVDEWLMPMMPIAILSLAALIRAEGRLEGAVLLAPLLPFLAFSFQTAWGSEHGAYLAPMSIPLAFLTVRTFPKWTLGLAILLSFGFAIHGIRQNDKPEIAAEYALGAQGVSGDRPALYLVGNDLELKAIFIGCPSVKPFPLYLNQDNPVVKAGFPTLAAWLDKWKGREIYLTMIGKLLLENPVALDVPLEVQE